MKKYRALRTEIDLVDVPEWKLPAIERIPGAAKDNSYYNYFDTWAEARDFLLSVEQGKVAVLAQLLEMCQENIQKIMELRE